MRLNLRVTSASLRIIIAVAILKLDRLFPALFDQSGWSKCARGMWCGCSCVGCGLVLAECAVDERCVGEVEAEGFRQRGEGLRLAGGGRRLRSGQSGGAVERQALVALGRARHVALG
eukprot:COSAG04_NODE_9453_length_863_cov_0.891361_2_plen_116_part_01